MRDITNKIGFTKTLESMDCEEKRKKIKKYYKKKKKNTYNNTVIRDPRFR